MAEIDEFYEFVAAVDIMEIVKLAGKSEKGAFLHRHYLSKKGGLHQNLWVNREQFIRNRTWRIGEVAHIPTATTGAARIWPRQAVDMWITSP